MAKEGKMKEGKPNKRAAPTSSDKPAFKKPKTVKGEKPVGGAGPIARPITKKEKKELIRAKKAQRNKNFNLIQEATSLWEELRRQDIKPDKRSQLVTAVLKKVDGRIAELAGSHTASRIIQSCIKYGNTQERAHILKEMEPKLLELSKSPYGHFVVSKLIDTASKEQLLGLVKPFRGHIAELLRHPAGTHVLSDLYIALPPAQRNALAAEFYGREYTLFDSGTINNAAGPPAKLSDLLSTVDSAKQRAVMTHLAAALTPVLEKGLVDNQLAHRLTAEYLSHAPGSLVVDAVEALSGDALLHMVHTKEGAAAACMVLAYGNAKDRKKAVRSMKGHVGAMARDEWGHLVLVTALSVVDDTATLKKFITSELQGDVDELVGHKYGYRILMQLLHPYCTRCLPPSLMAILKPPQKVLDPGTGIINGSGAGGAEDDEDEDASESEEEQDGEKAAAAAAGPLGVSKKDNDIRRKELLQGGLGTALATACASAADELLRSQQGAEVVAEVCCGGNAGGASPVEALQAAVGAEAIDAVHAAVAEALAQPKPTSEGDKDTDEHLAVNFFASRALRRLAQNAADGSAAQRCVDSLWTGAFKGRCKDWYGTHAEKILAGVVQGGSKNVKAAAMKELKGVVAGGDVEGWLAKFAAKGKERTKKG